MCRARAGLLLSGWLLTIALPASAEEPCPPGGSAPAAVATPAAPPATGASVAGEQRAFESEIGRFTKLWAFTQKLLAERELRAFEAAALHYQRLAELTRKLALAEEQALERDFEREVSLYVRKRELTHELASGVRPEKTQSRQPSQRP